MLNATPGTVALPDTQPLQFRQPQYHKFNLLRFLRFTIAKYNQIKKALRIFTY